MKINFKQLDVLRGLASLYVVINHCRGNLYIGGSKLADIIPVNQWSIIDKIYMTLLKMTILGSEFVILFFVLSGFSISHSLSSNFDFISFYKKRIIRIYPVYVLGIIYAILIYTFLRNLRPEWFLNNANQINTVLSKNLDFLSTRNIVSSLLYIPKGSLIAQFWSLSHEVLFYLISPFIFFNKYIYLCASVILFLGSIAIYGLMDINLSIIENYLFNYNIYFAMGVVCYLNKGVIINYIPRLNISVTLIMISFFLLIITKSYFGGPNKVSGLIALLGSGLLIFTTQKYNLTNKYLLKIGVFSYTLYVFHVACIYLFKLVLSYISDYEGEYITNKFIWIIGVVFCVLTSYLFYFIAEKPTKILLSKMRNKHTQLSKT